jgi:hypothetical protein
LSVKSTTKVSTPAKTKLDPVDGIRDVIGFGDMTFKPMLIILSGMINPPSASRQALVRTLAAYFPPVAVQAAPQASLVNAKCGFSLPDAHHPAR